MPGKVEGLAVAVRWSEAIEEAGDDAGAEEDAHDDAEYRGDVDVIARLRAPSNDGSYLKDASGWRWPLGPLWLVVTTCV